MLVLKRLPEYLGCTPGHFFIGGEPFRASLELPWKNNEPFVSCIPAGIYPVSFTHSSRFKRKVLLIEDVPGRDGVRIHPFNAVSESDGCISAVTDLIIQPHAAVFGRNSATAVEALEVAFAKGLFTTLRVESHL